MSKRLRIIIALVAGLFAAIVAMGYLAAREAQLIEMSEPLQVIVATTDIEPGTVLGPDILDFAEVPARFVQPGYLTDPRDVLDRVARVAILEGEQLTSTKIVSADIEPLASLLPPGYRGVTVAVNDVSGVAGLVRPGDEVDIVGIFELGRRADQLQTQARFMLQKVLVVAIDQTTSTEGLAGEDVFGVAGTVTLALPPDDAQTLVLAQQVGQMFLLLRGRREETDPMIFEILDPQKMLGTDLPIWSPALEEAEFQRQLMQGIR